MRVVPAQTTWLAILLLATALSLPSAFGQTVRVPESQILLDQAYTAMYNLNFDAAFQKAEQAKTLAKDDPIPWVAEACAALFREFDRLHILRSEMFSSDESFDARKRTNGTRNPGSDLKPLWPALKRSRKTACRTIRMMPKLYSRWP